MYLRKPVQKSTDGGKRSLLYHLLPSRLAGITCNARLFDFKISLESWGMNLYSVLPWMIYSGNWP